MMKSSCSKKKKKNLAIGGMVPQRQCYLASVWEPSMFRRQSSNLTKQKLPYIKRMYGNIRKLLADKKKVKWSSSKKGSCVCFFFRRKDKREKRKEQPRSVTDWKTNFKNVSYSEGTQQSPETKKLAEKGSKKKIVKKYMCLPI
ncbi:MAG: hypothetical protein ACLUTU_09705 [Blautia faecis]